MSNYAQLISRVTAEINQAKDIDTLEKIRIKYLGKKGYFTLQLTNLHRLLPEQRIEVSSIFNKAKKRVLQSIKVRKTELENITLNTRLKKEKIDISLPGRFIKHGSFHPVTLTIDVIERFFTKLGFSIELGQEIEDNYHNFDALNIPIYHPVRDDHDTFWFDATHMLRTHTSSVQIRIMKNQTPPIQIISSGRVYRNDYDKTHTPMFHQIEGIMVDKNISFVNLKGTMCSFLRYFFEEKIKINFRTSYFPFTEPSAEIDVLGNDKWTEILGCGMIHPNVLHNVGINSDIYSGFAFGMGVERLAMLRYGVNDIREFFENDLRFLKQFR